MCNGFHIWRFPKNLSLYRVTYQRFRTVLPCISRLIYHAQWESGRARPNCRRPTVGGGTPRSRHACRVVPYLASANSSRGLDNHFHLPNRPQGASISRIMPSLLVSHTQRYHAGTRRQCPGNVLKCKPAWHRHVAARNPNHREADASRSPARLPHSRCNRYSRHHCNRNAMKLRPVGCVICVPARRNPHFPSVAADSR
jgi:hypothetical protein